MKTIKGDVEFMKHIVEVKMPRLFGKKAKDESEVRTEVDLEDKEKSIPTALLITAPLVVGMAIAYMAGYNRGVSKGPTVIVVK